MLHPALMYNTKNPRTNNVFVLVHLSFSSTKVDAHFSYSPPAFTGNVEPFL
jgi:hypothetical protein